MHAWSARALNLSIILLLVTTQQLAGLNTLMQQNVDIGLELYVVVIEMMSHSLWV